MKKIAILIILSFLIHASYCQGNEKRRANFIIMVDRMIPFQGDINLKLVLGKENKTNDTINVSYLPGSMFLSEVDFNKVQSKAVKSIALAVSYTSVCKEVKSYNYIIEIYSSWLVSDFTILRIYNLNDRKNKKIFFPFNGLPYTYEVDSPNGSITRIKKKGYKECN
jgi:hypothetical protein